MKKEDKKEYGYSFSLPKCNHYAAQSWINQGGISISYSQCMTCHKVLSVGDTVEITDQDTINEHTRQAVEEALKDIKERLEIALVKIESRKEIKAIIKDLDQRIKQEGEGEKNDNLSK